MANENENVEMAETAKEVTEETCGNTQVSNMSAELYAAIIAMEPNIEDINELIKLLQATIVESITVQEGTDKVSDIIGSIMVETSNTMEEIKLFLITNGKLKTICEDKGFALRYVPMTNNMEYGKDGITLLINMDTNEIRASREGVEKEFIDTAYQHIKEATDELRAISDAEKAEAAKTDPVDAEPEDDGVEEHV